jgi:DNA polymerase-3 subunit alpha
MMNLLKRMGLARDLSFSDLVVATSVFRPGPMQSGLMEKYLIGRERGTGNYFHPSVKPELENTFGAIIFQEQLMAVVREVAGFTNIEADHVRKATSKKNLSEMQKWRSSFVEGSMAGFIEVEMEDGSMKRVHRLKKFMCADGERRTVEEAFACGADIDLK